MENRYCITPTQAKVLQTLGESDELSPAEIAVYARLMPNRVNAALTDLERWGLVNSSYPITGRNGERLVTLAGEGHAVQRALAHFRGDPPIGVAVPIAGSIPSFSGSIPSFSGWLQGINRHVMIVSDDSGR